MDIAKMIPDLSDTELNKWLVELTREKEARDAQREAKLWENVVKAIKAYCDEFSFITVYHEYDNPITFDEDDDFNCIGEITIRTN